MILCLPDEAAKEAVTLIDNPAVRVIDASTAYRVDPAWTYGFAEMAPGQRERIAGATRVSNPGCYPTGFIGLIAAYKFGDTMAASLIGPFMRDWGLQKEAIALIKGTVGSSAGLAGAAIGGWAAWRFGRRPALLVFGLAQTASIALYALAGLKLGGVGMVWAACIAEHALGGMATVALFTLMMDASDPDHAGTDYSLYACAIVLTQGAAAFVGGAVGDAAGYVSSFVVATLASGVGCLLLVARLDRGAGPAALRAHWRR